jgi:hypothetical protein
LPAREIGYAILCFYLGVNLMTQLDDDNSRVESLFELAGRLAPLVSPMLQNGLP